ncbi:MAG: hypothetical protein ACYC6Y_27140 [Thermoguttaceae bacterium]
MNARCLAVASFLAAWAAVANAQTELTIKPGQETAPALQRYGQELDLDRYPQGTPQETIESVIKAMKVGDIHYMLAHLVSPTEVDRKLKGDPEAFQKLAQKAAPEKTDAMLAELQRLLDDGTWTMRRNLCWATVDGTRDLSLERLTRRWFMHNTPVKRPTTLP